MAKRFIDTEMFNDEWFSELSMECKMFFIYFITTCDYAGVLKFNKKLCEFQTGLKSLDRLIEELGDSLVRVNQESVYFMPRFIKFQYPGFPNSKAVQQNSAVKILKQYGFWDYSENTYLRVNRESPDSPVNVNVNENVNGNDIAMVNEVNVNKVKKLTREENSILDDKTGNDLPF